MSGLVLTRLVAISRNSGSLWSVEDGHLTISADDSNLGG